MRLLSQLLLLLMLNFELLELMFHSVVLATILVALILQIAVVGFDLFEVLQDFIEPLAQVHSVYMLGHKVLLKLVQLHLGCFGGSVVTSEAPSSLASVAGRTCGASHFQLLSRLLAINVGCVVIFLVTLSTVHSAGAQQHPERLVEHPFSCLDVMHFSFDAIMWAIPRFLDATCTHFTPPSCRDVPFDTPCIFAAGGATFDVSMSMELLGSEMGACMPSDGVTVLSKEATVKVTMRSVALPKFLWVTVTARINESKTSYAIRLAHKRTELLGKAIYSNERVTVLGAVASLHVRTYVGGVQQQWLEEKMKD
ncbi:hypothetical protein B0H10DRAFT_1960722 [Mycena sp. CBHHK59/15]|nr:hypothetical protein B0H10DRAFT_1960722 [Mycena sp. CBHHK59/15]